jgi:hypothetical protein
MVFKNLKVVNFQMTIFYGHIYIYNVEDSHSWTKSHKTQNGAKFELGPFLFLLKEGEKVVES